MTQYNSKAELLKLGEADPELAELLKHGGNDLNSLMNSIDLTMVAYAEFARQPAPGTTDTDHEYDIKIPMRDGHKNLARIFKPDSPVPGRPTVVMIHGGGWMIGHPTHVGRYARGVAKLFGTNVISISHRLAPEFKFPTHSNDIWDSLEWIFSTDGSAASVLGEYTKTSFIIGGISAGGNLSAVTAQKWVSAQKTPKLIGVWLNIPYVLERELVPEQYADLWLSRDQNTESLVINTSTLQVVKDAYQPDFSSPDFSPFNDKNAHKGLPPVYFQVCGQDPLRDDAIIYEKVLRDNGVSTRIDVYPGVPHGIADVLPTFSLSQKYIADSMKGFGWLFGEESVCSDANIEKALAPA